MEYKKQGHCVYYAKYHLVLVTKYRKKIFNEGVQEYLKKVLKQVSTKYPEIWIDKIETDEDHAHILVSIPPKLSVSKVVGIIKSNSGREVREKYEFLSKVYWGTSGIWSDGYFVSTVGINEEIIRRYIEYQGREDCGQAKLEMV